MQIEPVVLFGRTGRDFVVYGDDGLERFAARLWDDETTLHVTWTDNLPRTAIRVREVQRLAGGTEAFDTIKGQASDHFRDLLVTGSIEYSKMEDLMSRALRSNWRLSVEARPGSIPATFDITFTRTEG